MNQEILIKRADFSKGGLTQAVLKGALAEPLVIYPIAAGVLAGFGMWIFSPFLWLIIVTGVTLGTAVVIWVINITLRRDVYANIHLKYLFTAMEAQRQERIKLLQERFAKAGTERGAGQFQRLNEKFEAFQSILSEKLNQGELTYSRYLGMAEQLYLGTLDNLYDLVNILQSIRALDKESDLTKAQEIKQEFLLGQNEQALATLDNAIVALTDMRTGESRANADLEMAMVELQRLSKRSALYNRQ